MNESKIALSAYALEVTHKGRWVHLKTVFTDDLKMLWEEQEQRLKNHEIERSRIRCLSTGQIFEQK